jgi:4-alpha-glucanotransferase
MVTLEDLLAEHDPQNIPGTPLDRPNFAQRMGITLEEAESDKRILEPLQRLDQARKRAADTHVTGKPRAPGKMVGT